MNIYYLTVHDGILYLIKVSRRSTILGPLFFLWYMLGSILIFFQTIALILPVHVMKMRMSHSPEECMENVKQFVLLMPKIVRLISKKQPQMEVKFQMQSFSKNISYISAFKNKNKQTKTHHHLQKNTVDEVKTWHPAFSLIYLCCRKQSNKFLLSFDWRLILVPGDQSYSYCHVNKQKTALYSV